MRRYCVTVPVIAGLRVAMRLSTLFLVTLTLYEWGFPARYRGAMVEWWESRVIAIRVLAAPVGSMNLRQLATDC